MDSHSKTVLAIELLVDNAILLTVYATVSLGIGQVHAANTAIIGALTKDQIDEHQRLCHERVEQYVAQRGEHICVHRGKSAGYLPGTLKHEALKRAQFRCKLCGISAECASSATARQMRGR